MMLVNVKLEKEDYISRLQTLLIVYFYGTTETKLAILAFMYCEEFAIIFLQICKAFTFRLT